MEDISVPSHVVELNPGLEVEKEARQNLVKVVLVGDAEVGKSQALLVMTNKPFSDEYDKTVGLEFGTRVVVCDGIPIKLQLWDIAGDETTRELTHSYYRNAPLFCVMWGDPAGKSLAVVKSEVEFIERCFPKATIVFVRCQSDRDAKLTMDVENQLKSIEATTKGRPIFHTSAKTGEGIDDLLRAIAIVAAALPDVKARAEVKAESPVLQRGARYGLSTPKLVVLKSNPFAVCLRNPNIMLRLNETYTHIVNPKDSSEPEMRIREAQSIEVPKYDKKDRQFRFERIREIMVNLTQEDLKPETIWLLLNLLSIGQRKVSFGSKSIVSGYIETVLEKLFICAPGEIEAFVLRKINAENFCESEFPNLNMKELIGRSSSSLMCAVLHLLQLLDGQERDIRIFNSELIEPTKQVLYKIARAVFEKPEMTKEDISALLEDKQMFPKIKAEVEAILVQYLPNKPVLDASMVLQ